MIANYFNTKVHRNGAICPNNDSGSNGPRGLLLLAQGGGLAGDGVQDEAQSVVVMRTYSGQIENCVRTPMRTPSGQWGLYLEHINVYFFKQYCRSI